MVQVVMQTKESKIIVGTPPSPLLKGVGGVGPSKNSVTWGIRNFLLERGDKPERWGWCRNGGIATFFITLQFNHIYFVYGKSKVSFITSRFSSKSL